MSHSHGHSHGGHSHSHSHGHSHGHGGHSHGENPYARDCQALTSAAVLNFLSAFVGALSAVSLPTHITGYFLPTVPRTALLWATVASGGVYAALCCVVFFGVLGEATSEGYRAPVRLDGEEEEEDETEKRMGRLRWVSGAASGAAVVEAGLSVALFALGLRFAAEEWNEWWSLRQGPPRRRSTDAESRAAAVLTLCEEMHLNQTYLVLGIPGLLLLLELFRALSTHRFAHLALSRPLSSSQDFVLPAPDAGEAFPREKLEDGIQHMRELGRRRRRAANEARRRRYRAGSGSEDSEGEDEKALLSA
ncbi:hypothetical protein JCM8097_002652 [Rhodosporidiobolus ruineniae]